MSKFHINKNGVPAPCRATKRKCPLGGESGTESHFDSKEEAQEEADKRNQSEFGLISSVDSPSNEGGEENKSSSISEFIKSKISIAKNTSLKIRNAIHYEILYTASNVSSGLRLDNKVNAGDNMYDNPLVDKGDRISIDIHEKHLEKSERDSREDDLSPSEQDRIDRRVMINKDQLNKAKGRDRARDNFIETKMLIENVSEKFKSNKDEDISEDLNKLESKFNSTFSKIDNSERVTKKDKREIQESLDLAEDILEKYEIMGSNSDEEVSHDLFTIKERLDKVNQDIER